MRRLLHLVSLCMLAVALAGAPSAASIAARDDSPLPATGRAGSHVAYLPIIMIMQSSSCAPIAGVAYQGLFVGSAPSDRPAAAHADLNLALRSYAPTSGELGLVDYQGDSDTRAPQLPGLFADRRTPLFRTVNRVYDWNWGCNCRANPISWPPVTLATVATTPGEIISLPGSGYSIGDGYMALVLYASAERLTLKYTRDDNVVHGYTVHLEGMCVEPSLLALYQSLNAAGRVMLPALRGGQALGRTRDASIGVAIRDTGSFMDPRSRKDWWQGR